MGNSSIVKDEDEVETRRDGISRLPDDILHHILYFNGMKQAVQTSMLSKRWRNVWRRMPQLNFDFSEFLHKKDPNLHLSNFAERAVVHRWNYEYCPLRKIRFALNDWGKHALWVNWWLMHFWVKKVETVVVGLEEVELLCMRRHQPEAELPQALRFSLYPWASRKLVTRSLELWNLRDCEHSEFDMDDTGSYQLENLLIANCTYKAIRISQKELKVLKLWRCGTVNCHIRVSAPKLRLLDCRQIPIANLCLENSLDSILDAVLDFTICPEDRDVDDVIKMVDALHNVKSLTLCNSIIKCLNKQRYVFEHHPTFHNLKHVVLLFETSNQPIAIKRDLLQRWPNLETLEIKECGSCAIITNSGAVLQNALSNNVGGGRPLLREFLLGFVPGELQRSPMLIVGVVGVGLVLYLEFRHELRGSMWRSLVSRVFAQVVGRCRSC